MGWNGTSSCTIGCMYMKSFVFAISCIRTPRSDVANFYLYLSALVPEYRSWFIALNTTKFSHPASWVSIGFHSHRSFIFDLGSWQPFCPTVAFSVWTCSLKDAMRVCTLSWSREKLLDSGSLCRERFPTEGQTFFLHILLAFSQVHTLTIDNLEAEVCEKFRVAASLFSSADCHADDGMPLHAFIQVKFWAPNFIATSFWFSVHMCASRHGKILQGPEG